MIFSVGRKINPAINVPLHWFSRLTRSPPLIIPQTWHFSTPYLIIIPFHPIFTSCSSYFHFIFIHLWCSLRAFRHWRRAARYTDLLFFRCYQFYAQIYRQSDKSISMFTPFAVCVCVCNFRAKAFYFFFENKKTWRWRGRKKYDKIVKKRKKKCIDIYKNWRDQNSIPS